MADATNHRLGHTPDQRPDGLGCWIRIWDVLASLVLTIAAFAAVRLDGVPHLLAQATDKSFFARRPLLLDTYRHGYDFEQVRDHLHALGEEGRAYYAHTFTPIHDLALSLFILTFSISFILWATQPGRTHALPVSPMWRRLLLVPPVLQFLLDAGENLTLRHLMNDFPRISLKVVETASQLTQMKWMAILATALVVIGLAVFTLAQMLAPRRA